MALNLEIALLSSLELLYKFSPKFILPARSLWLAVLLFLSVCIIQTGSHRSNLFFIQRPRYSKLFDIGHKGVENRRCTPQECWIFAGFCFLLGVTHLPSRNETAPVLKIGLSLKPQHWHSQVLNLPEEGSLGHLF